jgi:peptidyl-prolyl cis-trans isomerase C
MKKARTVRLTSLNTLGAMLLMGLAAPAHAQALSDGRSSVSLAEIEQELQAVPAEVRANMNREQMARFVSNMLVDRRLAAAAAAAGTPDLPDVRASVARSSRNIVVRAFVEDETEKLAKSLPNLEKLARERYEVNKSSYVIPAAIRVSHILFRVSAEESQSADAVVKAKAEQVLARIRNGEDFGKLAQEFSEDPGSSRNSGELPGWSDKGKLVPPFEEAAYALKPGEMSGLVRTRFGYHIIKLLEIREPRQQTFEEVRESVLTILRNEFLASKRTEWMKQYQGTKPIVLDDVTLEALKKP